MKTAFPLARRSAPVRRQAGIGLIEIIIVLGLVGALIAGVLGFRAIAVGDQRTQDTIRAVTQMASDISNTHRRANTFAGVTNASVIAARMVVPPFRADGTSNIFDPNGGVTTIIGGPVFFGMSFTEADLDSCIEIVTSLHSGASRMIVAPTAVAFATGASALSAFAPGTAGVVKADPGAAMNLADVTTACTGGVRFISVVYS